MAEIEGQRHTTSGRLVRRSLGKLRPVRGLIVVTAIVGVMATALPYVTATTFGPMMQVVADAGASGNLSGVWDLRTASMRPERLSAPRLRNNSESPSNPSDGSKSTPW